MFSTQGLAKLAAVVMTVLALIAGPWALLGGVPMVSGQGWRMEPPVTPWIPVVFMLSLSVSFLAWVLQDRRGAWLWLVPFVVLVVLSPPSASVLFLLPLVSGILSAVLMALSLPLAD